MPYTLFAFFDDRGTAHHAMTQLLAAGYSHDDVSVSNVDPTGAIDSLRQGYRVAGTQDEEVTAPSGISSRTCSQPITTMRAMWQLRSHAGIKF